MTNRQHLKYMIFRFIIFVIGILVLALGLVLSTKTNLGVSAINSVPYSFSYMTNLTLGTCTMILYLSFILIELFNYRKIALKTLLQIPFSFIMGRVIDFFNNIISYTPQKVSIKVVMLFIAIILTALGSFLMTQMQLVVSPGDGIVSSVAYVFNSQFGKCKVYFDLFMVLFTSTVTIVVKGSLIGIGIGTIISALLVGVCISFYNRKIGATMTTIVLKSKEL